MGRLLCQRISSVLTRILVVVGLEKIQKLVVVVGSVEDGLDLDE